MAVQPGRRHIGEDCGRLLVRTFREGVAAQAGHDLTIELTRWSGELTVADDLTPAALDVHVDVGSLQVREGTGGVKPLSDRDRREIAVNARKTLNTDRYPEAVFTAGGFEPADGSGWMVEGTLTLHGQRRPLRLRVTSTGQDRFRATASVVQTDHGITPYRGFFGALKVRDAVDVEAEVDLSAGDGD